MSTVAIIQARMTSSRLPGKVLAELAGHPMLHHVVARARAARSLDAVVVATTDQLTDDAVAAHCAKTGVPCFRGSEDDVLDRYRQAAQAFGADVVVRLTADCPLHDPRVVDQVVDAFCEVACDYACNVMPPTFPDGLDTEVFSFDALERAHAEAQLKSEREHVTLYLRSHPERFRLRNVCYERDLSHLRWTVDEPADLELARAVYAFAGRDRFGMDEVLRILAAHPELTAVNRGIARNEGLQKSMREDRVEEERPA